MRYERTSATTLNHVCAPNSLVIRQMQVWFRISLEGVTMPIALRTAMGVENSRESHLNAPLAPVDKPIPACKGGAPF